MSQTEASSETTAVREVRSSARLGIRVAVSYVALLVILFVVTFVVSKPDDVGLEWIPFVTLAWPWYQMNPQLLFLDLLLNAGLLFGMGSLLGYFRQRIVRNRRPIAATVKTGS